MNTIHPRPNPIVAAMYTLRDLDVDVIIVHGPAGCGFMASRMLEEAGIRVVTSALVENDLVFGGSEKLIRTIKESYDRFHPKTIAVIGTCASMIIGEDMKASIRKAGVDSLVFPVDCHGCMGDNTAGATMAIESARDAGLISADEASRQISNMRAATEMEKKFGMASRGYLSPTRGPTKMTICKEIITALSEGKKVAVIMIAKKELAYRFADIFLAIDYARRKLGGETYFIANLDKDKGLPRIRRYCNDILNELSENDISIDSVIGGLDEYALSIGEKAKDSADVFDADLKIIVGMPHAYPELSPNDILITDQPRQLANLLNKGFERSLGEISSHSMVMGTDHIISMETGDTIRELTDGTISKV